MTPTLGGPIDPVFFARYNATVQAALSSGPNVWVIIDVVSPHTSPSLQTTSTHRPHLPSLAQLRPLERLHHRPNPGRPYQRPIRLPLDPTLRQIPKHTPRHLRPNERAARPHLRVHLGGYSAAGCHCHPECWCE